MDQMEGYEHPANTRNRNTKSILHSPAVRPVAFLVRCGLEPAFSEWVGPQVVALYVGSLLSAVLGAGFLPAHPKTSGRE